MPETRDVRLAALLSCGVFAVYAFCAYPAFAPRDSADLALAALTLGVAHPPGYPLYSVLGKAWLTLLPLGNPAYRLNLLSALCGSLACGTVFAFLRRRLGAWPALGGSLALAFSAPLWKMSLLEEMYSLHALFIAGLLLLYRGDRASLLKRAALSGLLFGLGLVNHQSLILFAPGLAWLWRAELARHDCPLRRVLPAAAGLGLLGLALYAFVPLRLQDWRLAWAVLTRAEYGSAELFAGFSRPLTAPLAAGLLSHLCRGLWEGSGVVLVLALVGALELRRREPDLAVGLLLGLAAFGPLFFLLTRLDLSEWVAKTVLEPAFVAPAVLLGVAAGYGIAFCARWKASAAVLALGVAGLAAFFSGPAMYHRDDFSAYDYAQDLRRSLPPGSAALVGGDTALFALRYLEEVEPSSPPRVLVSSREPGLKGWIAAQMTERPVYVLGLSFNRLAELGLTGSPYQAWPAGLVQRVLTGRPAGDLESRAWAVSNLRPSRALQSGESYAHDIRLSYAFAHYISGQLEERLHTHDPSAHYALAARIDPEDYQLVIQPSR